MFLCTWVIESIKCREWFSNHVPFVVETVNFLMTSSAYKHRIFFAAVVLRAQMSVAFVTYHSCVKEAFVKRELNGAPIIIARGRLYWWCDPYWYILSHFVPKLRLTVCSCHITLFVQQLGSLFIFCLHRFFLWCLLGLDSTPMCSCAVWDLEK